MNNMVSFGSFYPASSWIHRLDPRTKIIATFVIMLSLFFVSNLTVLLIALLLSLVLIAMSRVPFLRALSSLKGMAALLLVSGLFQVLMNHQGTVIVTASFDVTVLSIVLVILVWGLYFWSGRHVKVFRISLMFVALALSVLILMKLPIAHLFGEDWQFDVPIYDASLYNAGVIFTRVATIVFVSTLLTFTTKTTDLNTGLSAVLSPLKKIHVPVDIFAMMIAIALRYIPTIMNEAQRILKSQASRGADLSEGSLMTRLKQTTGLLIPLFVIAFNRGAELADAMAARGYDPDKPRTTLRELAFKAPDVIVLVLVNIGLVCAIVTAIIG